MAVEPTQYQIISDTVLIFGVPHIKGKMDIPMHIIPRDEQTSSLSSIYGGGVNNWLEPMKRRVNPRLAPVPRLRECRDTNYSQNRLNNKLRLLTNYRSSNNQVVLPRLGR